MRPFAALILAFALTLPAVASDDCLKSVGAAHGANLFNTYTAIGAIADGYSSGMYTKSEVRDLMATQVGFAQTLRSGLDTLAAGGVSDTDKKTLARFSLTYKHLEAEARALIKYTETSDKADLEAYDAERKKAWALVEQILGLDRGTK